MSCPAADYCVMARGDSLMSFLGGRWTTYEPNVHMSDSSTWWDTLSCPTKGFSAAGTTSLGTNYLGVLENGTLRTVQVPNWASSGLFRRCPAWQ